MLVSFQIGGILSKSFNTESLLISNPFLGPEYSIWGRAGVGKGGTSFDGKEKCWYKMFSNDAKSIRNYPRPENLNHLLQ